MHVGPCVIGVLAACLVGRAEAKGYYGGYYGGSSSGGSVYGSRGGTAAGITIAVVIGIIVGIAVLVLCVYACVKAADDANRQPAVTQSTQQRGENAQRHDLYRAYHVDETGVRHNMTTVSQDVSREAPNTPPLPSYAVASASPPQYGFTKSVTQI